MGNISEPAFLEHQTRKNEGFALKEKDKASADNISKFVITSDTESLLLAPLNDADIMFFRTKLNLHNFTFYDLKTRKVMNYVWSEVNGEIEASNFTTCYIKYLTELKEKNPELNTVVFWTDGCTYQNRCNILSSALLTFAVDHNITIYHKYLEVGHTHMECDSVHSAIEKRKQLMLPVHLPTDYIDIIQSARKSKAGKYDAKYLEFSFFRDYKEVCDIKTIKPSKEVGPPYAVHIWQLSYTAKCTIKYNLTYDECNWKSLPYKIKLNHSTPKQLYASPLKISFSKWTHLQEIKTTIPKQFHRFYDQLRHHPKVGN